MTPAKYVSDVDSKSEQFSSKFTKNELAFWQIFSIALFKKYGVGIYIVSTVSLELV
jgi:hypothetical protein